MLKQQRGTKLAQISVWRCISNLARWETSKACSPSPQTLEGSTSSLCMAPAPHLKLRVPSSSAQVPVSRFPLKMSFNRPPPSPSRWTTLPSLSRVLRLFYLKKRSTYRLYLTALLRAPEAHVMESWQSLAHVWRAMDKASSGFTTWKVTVQSFLQRKEHHEERTMLFFG